MTDKNFIHLHVHGPYSIQDAMAKHKELISKAKEFGMDSIALTDHGDLFVLIDFYKEAVSAEIKPILGCEVYVAPRSNVLKEIGAHDNANYHLVLLCENIEGYYNLIK
jgi:DNA polymerase-3 subunit alpha